MYVYIREGDNHLHRQNSRKGRENGGRQREGEKESRRAKTGFRNHCILKITMGQYVGSPSHDVVKSLSHKFMYIIVKKHEPFSLVGCHSIYFWRIKLNHQH